MAESINYRFTGKEQDSETGLYYYGARYLDPKYSRWLSCDPALGEYVSGTSSGEGGIYNSINLNLYHYGGNNPVVFKDPTGMWIDNEDGTFTAQEKDTLWGLQQETGINWEKFDYQGKPEALQIGQTVNVVKPQEQNNHPTVDSTMSAVLHYYCGDGESVNLGENTISALKKSPEHTYNQKALSEGTAKSKAQRYGVDLTKGIDTYHVGDTVVTYDKSEGSKYRVVTYHAFSSDGFWDIYSNKGDGIGPKKELLGGTPYSYIPYTWTEVYKK